MQFLFQHNVKYFIVRGKMNARFSSKASILQSALRTYISYFVKPLSCFLNCVNWSTKKKTKIEFLVALLRNPVKIGRLMEPGSGPDPWDPSGLTAVVVCFCWFLLFSLCLEVWNVFFLGVPEWRLKCTQRHKEMQTPRMIKWDHYPVKRWAEEPEVVLLPAFQVQIPREPSGLPPESLSEDSVEDF